jgi:hypothetical protein
VPNIDNYYKLAWTNKTKLCLGEEFGVIHNSNYHFEGGPDYHLTSVIKNGITYFGTQNPLSIDNNITVYDSVQFFPNPASNQVQVNLQEPFKVSITDCIGKIVYSSELLPNEKIDVSGIVNGIYLLMLVSTKCSIAQKLVIQH